MKRLTGLILGVAAAGLIGCGDSGVECGPGTDQNDDGLCVPTGEPVTCTDGTILDEASNSCVIDPESCQGGTVLVGTECVDPTDGLTVDVTEAAEPNGFDINGELSDDPAGEFMVKPVGQTAVIQGNFTARPDRDEDGVAEGDVDTYLFQVDEPTLLEISVDGVGGSVGGFVSFAGDVQALANWIRFGVAHGGDTAKRQLFVPTAGIYLLTIADSRTLLGSGPDNAPDNKYFVSIAKKAIPTATALTFTNNEVVKFDKITSDEIDFYTAPFDLGFNRLELRSFDTDLEASLIVNVNGAVRAYSEETRSTTATNGDSIAQAFFAGVVAGATPLIVVDHVINTASTAVDYRLFAHTSTATALKTDDTAVTVDLGTPTPALVDELTQLYFDVNNTDQITGIDLSFNTEVRGQLRDQDGVVISNITGIGGAGTTFGGYKGLIRTPAPGRYYLIVHKPTGTVGEDLIATSRIAAVTPTTLTFNTPLTNETISADFHTRVYSYDSGADGELVHTAASLETDDIIVDFFDPDDAYGLLNPFFVNGGTNIAGYDPDPWFETGAFADDELDEGIIMEGLPEKFIVTVWTFADAGTFDIGTSARTFQDEGVHAGVVGTPDVTTHLAETLTDGAKRYLVRTTPGQSIKIDVTPTPTLNASITTLSYFEGGTPVNNGIVGVAETTTVVANAAGYVAFSVNAVAPSVGTTYDITITATAPTPPFYKPTASTTAWVNVCNTAGSTDVTPTGAVASSNEGVTAEITLPTGFKFFDADVTTIRASTNGWLTFLAPGSAAPAPLPTNPNMPSAAAPNGVIAAYWDDLVNTRICTQTVGTKFFVQWRGQVKNVSATTVVAFEVILDTADDSIELVYSPFHRGTGTTATAGVENAAGNAGTLLFFNSLTPLQLGGTATRLAP